MGDEKAKRRAASLLLGVAVGAGAASVASAETTTAGPTETGDTDTDTDTDALTDSDGPITPCLDVAVCLCQCSDREEPLPTVAWFALPALMIARRRRTRASVLDRLSARGALPRDVLTRLRARADDDAPDDDTPARGG